MNNDKKHISSIIDDIKDGKSFTAEKIEKMLLDYETARDKYSFLDLLYRELIEPGDDITVYANLFHGDLKDYIKDRKADFLKQINDNPESNSELGDPWDQLSSEQEQNIENALAGREGDGRSKYSIDEYRMYLAVHLTSPDSVPRRGKRDRAAKYLEGDKAARMKEAKDSRLKEWEDWLN